MEQESVEEVERIFNEVGIPCMRARTIEELCDTDPQVKAREMMPIIEQPFIGPMKMFGSPLKMSETPACVRGHSPLLGEHNDQVLTAILGYSEEQINALYEAKALYHEDAVNKLK
jgi:crotonobetainyl-CoA:carnitine CoA-transferase CaiB-like acyl-CoA transferase